MLLALVVGLAISFFQALTQIQEMTLTFVPKMIVILLSLHAVPAVHAGDADALSPKALMGRIVSG